MQIRIIIKHKNSSSHQKISAAILKKEKNGVFVSIFTNQERNTKISRTHPRLKVIDSTNTGGQGINKKRRAEGWLSLERKGGS